MTSPNLRTVAVAAGRPHEPGSPLNAPLVPASNFVLGGGPGYARDEGTATWHAFEALVGALEGGTAVAFSSGMAAIAAVIESVPLGGTIVWPDDCYQGVAGMILDGERAGRWSSVRLPVTATDAWVDASATADLVWVESPSNPLLEVADLRRIGGAARRPGSILAVDNTLAGPCAQRPLALGADVSVQSATKHLGGHSDLLLGVATARDEAIIGALHHRREIHGAAPGALEAFLATRGIRTYPLRAEAAARSALVIAERLHAHPMVDTVRFPGLVTDPHHTVAAAQLDSFGSVVSFDVRGGGVAADAVCAAVRLICHATSFGAVESTVERRSILRGQEHLPPGLLRLSVGIEDVEDVWADLATALDAADRGAGTS